MLSDNLHSDEHPAAEFPAFVFDRGMLAKVYLSKLKRLLIVTFIAVVIAGILVQIRLRPSWKANCYVIRAPKNMSTPADMPYLYQTFDINTILETVRTRDVLSQVISKLDLKIKPDELYRKIDVQRGNRSNVLRFSVSWKNPELAADIANAAAESFILHNVKLLNSATLKLYNYYLEQQALRLRNIEALEQQYEQHRAQYGVISIPQETQSKFDQLKEVELKMIENALNVKDLDSKIAEMQVKIDELPDEVVRTRTFTQTDAKKMLQLENELELLRSRYTDANPKVRKVLSEIEELKTIMVETDRDLPEATTWGPSDLTQYYNVDKSRFEAERKGALQKDIEFQLEVQKLRAALESLILVQRDFFEIERQLSLNQDILRLVESRLAESKMAMQSNISDYEILEEAKVPEHPEGARRKLILFAIGLIIFSAGSIFVLAKELLDTHTKSPKDFAEFIRIPLLGILPDETQVEENVFSRNLQVLVDKIVRLTDQSSHPVICVGSDIPETGKSFLMKDCIAMFNQQNKKVLYIETIKETRSETEDYILDPWQDDGDQSNAIDTSNALLHNAYFLADDSIFSKVLSESHIRKLLDRLPEYDYIFWELLEHEYNVSVFSSIAASSDLLILVARFKSSSRSSLKRLTDYLKQRDFTKIHGVLNYVHKDFFREYY
ncbi:MAG: hypothetical protein LHW64_00765 [Candidatus Cloacimonetes bacterium]|nr:hypothetical protein [Candidatus Cloacimonadota bacterium]MCB5286319.1 hypothetical protein [Candidatus Cloacimonadota bacterium]MCK9184034.1 hypothetical protein [Candidatus Cloacimonadota bacterium]MCK9583718.1 hypothetical protein [Candidatus Cloacimonadota bacterium]MDY0228641.1 hypothetical protein [Candidatus Cloacimonadaceae bacterium]